MSIIQGKLIRKAVDVTIEGQGGKEYKGFKLVVDTAKGVQTIAKPMASLTYNPELKKTINSLNIDDDIKVVQEKNDRGYLEIKSITVGLDAVNTGVKAGGSGGGAGGGFGSNNRDWETKEERTLRQSLIVAQSSLDKAVAMRTQEDTEYDVIQRAARLYMAVYDIAKGDLEVEPAGRAVDSNDDIPF